MTNNHIFMCTQLLLYLNQSSETAISMLYVSYTLLGFFVVFCYFKKLDKNDTNTLSNFSKEKVSNTETFRFKQLNSFWFGFLV